MQPYRDAPKPIAADPGVRPSEERVLYGLLALGGLVRLAIGIAATERFGAELTIAAILMILGVLGLIKNR